MVTQSYVDKACMIGSNNAAWVPLALDGGTPNDAFKVIEQVRNVGSTDYYLQYVLPLPTSRGGKTLYMARVKVMLTQADGNNFLDMIKVLGIRYNGVTNHYENQGNWDDQEDIDEDISPDKSAQYDDQVIVTLYANVASAENLRIAGVLLKVYYD